MVSALAIGDSTFDLLSVIVGQVFCYGSAGDWFDEGYKTLLIYKYARELFVYGFIGYWLLKRTTRNLPQY
jgi:hypothetical protein